MQTILYELSRKPGLGLTRTLHTGT